MIFEVVVLSRAASDQGWHGRLAGLNLKRLVFEGLRLDISNTPVFFTYTLADLRAVA